MTTHESAETADNRTRIVQAAAAVFAEEGYHAGVDRIAARAGVAKQTLYNHFPGKAELFAEVVRQAVASLLVTLDDDGPDLRTRLVRFAVRFREKLLCPAGLGFFRAMVAETTRFPELSTAFYREGPAKTEARLREVLADAMARGVLERVDPAFAATMLLSMLAGAERTRYLFLGPEPDALDERRAEEIVDRFLRAFAQERNTHPRESAR